MAEPLTLARSGPDAMSPSQRNPGSEHGERLARLEADSEAAKRSERDLWTKLNEYRDDTRDDIATLSAEFRKVVEVGMAADKERAVANAAFVARADELLERVGDCVRRQDAIESVAGNYRESAQRKAEDITTATDTRMRAIETAQRDGIVRRNALLGAWATIAGLIGAGLSTLLHKVWP